MKKWICLVFILPNIVFAQSHKINGLKAKASQTLALSELFHFGADNEEDHYLWPVKGTSFTVLDNGHILIGDPAGARILEFDAKGQFVKLVASKGNGPGELRGLYDMTVAKDGSLYVLDGVIGSMVNLQVFDKNMKFVEMKSLAKMGIPFSLQLSQDKKFAFSNYMSFGQELTLATGMFDFDKQSLIQNFSSNSRPMPNFAQGFQQPNFWEEFFARSLKDSVATGNAYAHLDHAGRLYVANAKEYKVVRYGPDYKTPELSFSREYKPIINTEEELDAMAQLIADEFRAVPGMDKAVTPKVLERAIEKADLPPGKLPINALISMPEGHLIVVHGFNLYTGETIGDIFNEKGEYIGQFKLPDFGMVHIGSGGNRPRLMFKNGRAYSLQTDEDGDNRLFCYEYKFTKAHPGG